MDLEAYLDREDVPADVKEAIQRDIIERKQAEEKLKEYAENLEKMVDERTLEIRESKERLAVTLRSIGDGVIATDTGGKILLLNKIAEKLTGWTQEEALGKPLNEVFHIVNENTRERCENPVEKVLKTGVVVGLANDTVLVARDGTERVLADSGAPIRDKDGSIIGVVLVFRDITERKKMDDALRKRTHDLGERVKELNCLYGISKLVETPVIVLEEVLQGIVELMPPSWQYPEITCARIILENQIFRTKNFEETIWKQASGIIVHGNRAGTVEVYYLEEKPDIYEGPFLKEERHLINAIGERVGKIIEHKRAEEKIKEYIENLEKMVDERTSALKETEERYRGLYESSIDGIVSTDIEGNLVECNQAYADMLGYTKEEVYTLTYQELTPSKWHEMEAQIVTEQIIPRGYSEEYEKEYIRKDGTIFPISLRAWHIKDKEGNITGMWGIVRDITERKREEEASLRLAAIVESSDDAIIGKTLNGIISSWNKGAEEIYGYSAEEVQGQPISLLVPPDRSDEVPQILEKLKLWEHIDHFETVRMKKDGEQLHVSLSISLIKDADGNIIGASTIARDITERKQAEEKLKEYAENLEKMVDERTLEIRESKERLAVTLRSIGDGVIATDIGGKILLLNKIAEKLIGWTQDEALGKPLNQVFHIINENTRERCENPVEKVLKTGVVIGLANDTVLVTRDGTERLLADSGAPIRDDDGNIIGVVLVFRDVTEKRKMEEELLKIQKLESLGILAGGIAHDFNNILTSILGNISLAKLHAQPRGKVFDRLTEAEKAMMRAKNLTHQLLTFSTGGAPIKKTASISELLKDTVSFALSGSHVMCEFSIPAALWIVEIDEGQISQVIHNIVINADQAMPEGGIIEVSAANMTVGAKSELPLNEGNYVKIAIKDPGLGIPKEHLPKIFDPFFTTKQKGSGLGLATVYSIIKNHDGHITVDSELGVGTTVYIYLPASDKEIAKKEVTEMKLVTGKGRILVMDDEESIREAVGEILTFLGYQVEFARDGDEAVTLYKNTKDTSQSFDAVILDLTIPGGMGGKETIKNLIEIDPEVKAVVSSGYSTDPIMAAFKKYGFSGVIAKPYNIKELSETLNKIIMRTGE